MLVNYIFVFQSLWTQDLSPNFHLFLCLAILKMEKDYIIENQYGFNEILKVLWVTYGQLACLLNYTGWLYQGTLYVFRDHFINEPI